MAARKTTLGDAFWGQFYRLDNDKYTEEKFRELVAALGLQTKLEVDGRTVPPEGSEDEGEGAGTSGEPSAKRAGAA